MLAFKKVENRPKPTNALFQGRESVSEPQLSYLPDTPDFLRFIKTLNQSYSSLENMFNVQFILCL